MDISLKSLVTTIQQCDICAEHFEHNPRPIVQVSPHASILIAGQAPGRKVHESGVPFDDPSGNRLREWLGVTPEIFYDANKIAILPMGFCYPGHGSSGDLPPRKECAVAWRQQVLDRMPKVQLTVVIGSYAMKWHLADKMKHNLTETVKGWESYLPEIIPLPHPSPRNNRWLSKNLWFESEVLPYLRDRVNNELSK